MWTITWRRCCWRRRAAGPAQVIASEVAGKEIIHQVVEAICALMDQLRPQGAPHGRLITYVDDRPGHNHRYANDPTLIRGELGWQPHYSFAQGLETTVRWFLDHPDWCELLNRRSSQTRS